jgi:carbon storage regulator
MPLVLDRKANESILIGDDILVTAVNCRRGRVKLSVMAPPDIKVVRSEISDKIVLTGDNVIRSKMMKIARDWCEYSQSGLDILASSCLDEMQAVINAVRA